MEGPLRRPLDVAGSESETAKDGFPEIAMSSFFASRHMPCADCGASVAAEERDEHTCDSERVLEFRLFQLRDGVAGFDTDLRGYLDSPEGRFEQWLAERDRPPS